MSAAPPAALVSAREMYVGYGRKQAVRGVSLDVAAGETIALIGPNGSGKSSLLRALAGRVPVDGGSVRIGGRDIARAGPRERARAAGLLEQRNPAPADLTVRELARYGRHPHRRWFERGGEADRDAVDWALAHTEMLADEDRVVAELSGGEAQRAWLAMVLAQRPRVLLLDEPTTYLDIAHQADVLEVVGELRRVLGMTVVLVLHDLNHVAAVADRVLALYEGVALATGTPAELFTPETIHALYGVAAEVAPGVDGGPPRIHLDHRARRDQRTQRTHPDQKERP